MTGADSPSFPAGGPSPPDRPRGDAPGVFVFSLDAELAWGTFDEGGDRSFRRHLARTRPAVAGLLSLFGRYRISATWAFVGHLFLESCARERPGDDPHPDVRTPSYAWYPFPWHHRDPSLDRRRAPFWYGDDLVDQVIAADPPQDVGCHTFSHIPMDDPAVTEEIAASQIAKCCELARRRGLRMRSFVFPRHSVAHLPVLARYGFTCYRGPEEPWYRRFPSGLRPAFHFLHRLLALTPPVYRSLSPGPDGLVNIPSSMFLMPPDGIRRLIPGGSRVAQAARGIRRAAESGGVFHLWIHPWNLGSSPRMLDWIERILRVVSDLRARGRLRVMTMKSLAEEVRRNARADLRADGGIPAGPGPGRGAGPRVPDRVRDPGMPVAASGP